MAEEIGDGTLGTPVPGEGAGPSRPSRGPNATILRTLTFTQNVSAAVFSVFITMHLASPIAAAFGGIGAADQVLLIAREYYLPIEPLAIYAPIGIHIASSLTKRLYTTYYTRRPPPKTLHISSGYLLIPFVNPHILSHRIIPSWNIPSIRALSPSEFGYDFVGWNLRSWGAWATYLTLAGVGTLHWGIGTMKVVSWIKRGRRKDTTVLVDADKEQEKTRAAIPKRRRIGLRGLMLGFMGLITVGLIRISRDSRGSVSAVMASRYQAVYQHLPWVSCTSSQYAL